jgi:hypothetical protein
MSDKLTLLIEGRHPEYKERVKHWEFLEDTYEGGREWFKDHIFQFVKEGKSEFESRLKRAYRFNHTKQVVDQIDKYLFKMPVARKEEDADDFIKRFWERSTLTGLDIDTFAKRISNATSQYGRVYIVVDSNVDAANIKTVKDEKDANGQIYSYIVRPQDMLDMSYDEMGEFNWAMVREFSRDDDNPLESSKKMRERYRLWTRDGWTLYELQIKRGRKNYVQIDKGEHKLGIVPIIHADHVFSEEQFEAPGLIDDIAYLDRAVANYLSNLDAIIQDQTFSQLAMPAQGVLPGEEGYDKLVEMSTKRVFLYNGEAGSAPFYLSPDPKQAELILAAISKIINEIYHSVGLSGERTQSNSGGSDGAASGVAKSYDFERINSLLTSKAKAIEMTERQIIRMVALYAGKSESLDADELIEYPKEFDVRSVYDEFEIAARLSLLAAPDLVRREQMKTVIDKLFPAMSDATEKLMEDALKDWPPELIASAVGLGAPKEQGSGASNPIKAANTQRVAKELAA